MELTDEKGRTAKQFLEGYFATKGCTDCGETIDQHYVIPLRPIFGATHVIWLVGCNNPYVPANCCNADGIVPSNKKE